jgi:hypothetical protein
MTTEFPPPDARLKVKVVQMPPTQDCGALRKANGGHDAHGWPVPKNLPVGLPPVDPFSLDFVPDALKPWIDDIANRLQCPLTMSPLAQSSRLVL